MTFDVLSLIANPTTSKIPKDVVERIAIYQQLVLVSNRDNFEAIIKFISRNKEFSPELEVLTILGCTKKDVTLCDTPTFIKWARENSSLSL